jgi:hypothetical protein
VKPLVILGSARPDGKTRRAVEIAFPKNANLVVLSRHHIGGYDYVHSNDDDDFRLVVDAILKNERIVFATPVYWYAISAAEDFLRPPHRPLGNRQSEWPCAQGQESLDDRQWHGRRVAGRF